MPLNEDVLLKIIKRSAGESSDFDLNPALRQAGRILRPAAVLVPVIDSASGPRVILTKRSSQLKHHPGQIAFPGGKIDPQDVSPEAAALREADEEIGLARDHVRLLGRLPNHETVTGFSITPVIGVIEGDFITRPEAGEVAEVFDVPLGHLLNPQNYQIQHRPWLGQSRSYYAVPWGPYYIWGATARILYGMAKA